MQRGILTPPMQLQKLQGENDFRIKEVITSDEVNYLTLYWDKIVIPDNPVFSVGFHNEADLKECGILSRPMMSFRGGDFTKDFFSYSLSQHQNILGDLRRQEKSTDWSVNQIGDVLIIDATRKNLEKSLKLELLNLLPVPSSDIPLENILDFKHRRRDELDALHGFMDELYRNIIASQDYEFEKTSSYARLEKAIVDLNRLNAEGWKSPLRFNVSLTFESDANALLQAFLATAIAADAKGALTSALVGMGSLALGMVKFNIGHAKPLSSDLERLAYISSANKEKIF